MRIIFKILTLVVIIGIAYLSLRPSVQLVEVNDKVGHFIAYFTLMFVMGLGFWKKKKELLMAFVMSALHRVRL